MKMNKYLHRFLLCLSISVAALWVLAILVGFKEGRDVTGGLLASVFLSIFGLVTAWFADRKGRANRPEYKFMWFMFGMIYVGFLVVAFLPNRCRKCGAVTESNQFLCDSCRRKRKRKRKRKRHERAIRAAGQENEADKD